MLSIQSSSIVEQRTQVYFCSLPQTPVYGAKPFGEQLLKYISCNITIWNIFWIVLTIEKLSTVAAATKFLSLNSFISLAVASLKSPNKTRGRINCKWKKDLWWIIRNVRYYLPCCPKQWQFVVFLLFGENSRQIILKENVNKFLAYVRNVTYKCRLIHWRDRRVHTGENLIRNTTFARIFRNTRNVSSGRSKLLIHKNYQIN